MYRAAVLLESVLDQRRKWPVGSAGQGGRVPWLAESATYNADSSQLTVKLRKGVTWSDGQPFTARDIVFTVNMLKANSPDLLFAFDMKTWVKDVTAPDDLTAKITLTSPNPQFLRPLLLLVPGQRLPDRARARVPGPGPEDVHQPGPGQGLAGDDPPVEAGVVDC